MLNTDKNSKINFYYIILLFNLAVNLKIKDIKEFLIGLKKLLSNLNQNFIINNKFLLIKIKFNELYCYITTILISFKTSKITFINL